MKKFLILATISVLTTLLLLGIFMPDTYPMLFAATTNDYIIIRIGMVVLLASLLIYQPPREPIFRGGLAVVATMLLISASSIFVSYGIKLFDAMIMLQAAILFYIEAAELGVSTTAKKRDVPVEYIAHSSKIQIVR